MMKCNRVNVTGVAGRGALRKTSCLETQEGHEGYGYEGGNGVGPWCLEEYYWVSDRC